MITREEVIQENEEAKARQAAATRRAVERIAARQALASLGERLTKTNEFGR